jgi:hypothetical protein
VIKTNKKIIYLSVFLVLALFLASACQNEAVSKKVINKEAVVDQETEGYGGVSYGTGISGCKIEYVQNTDFVSDIYNTYPFSQIASSEDKNYLATASVFSLKSGKEDGIKLTKVKNGVISTVTTNEAWLYYREKLTPIYPAVIFYKDANRYNKKSIFWNVLDEDETPYISCQ